VDPFFGDRYGTPVATEEEAVGHEINTVLTHPEYLLFKTGCNTNMSKDGNQKRCDRFELGKLRPVHSLNHDKERQVLP
jgi:hypothetical protein